MVTPLLFLTVSAFSTPLLENSSYHQQGNSCFLTINEERNQQDVVLLLTTSGTMPSNVTIFHQHAFSDNEQGHLTQSATSYNDWYANNDFFVQHKLYKKLEDMTIYATNLVTPEQDANTFIDTFKTRGNKTKIDIEGIADTFNFVADKHQADAFYQCTQAMQNEGTKGRKNKQRS
ncbi:hypothetical protein A3K86_22305 [Photobacterium jeanii]|uniref:Uncharacterized protein n=1 Tax=Photobacterium jeanii TaxID=858640 RepID=A0A178K2Z2_9GAMM|nr:hypothetical protein [Photobacterium jeanii]OAN11651.1 hypothetical protein A3K86_22305 [Photobacterium jeanii]PST91173.1 hypothetical protein C9I91_11415 [Photobacterium jeanii]